jgi:ABC-type multidrug transport system fused ATPase/permease subunit
MSDQAPTIIHNLKRLYSHFSSRRRWQLVALIGLMLIGAIAEMVSLGMVVPFLTIFVEPTKSTCDIFFVPCGLTLTTASLLFASTVAVAATVRLILNWASLRFTFGLGADISNEVYRRTLYQPYSFHVARNTSEIIGGINKASGAVGIVASLMGALVALFIGTSIIATLFLVDPKVTSIAIVGFGLLYGITITYTRKRLQANSRVIARTENQRIKAVQEGLGGIRDVLLDGTQPVYVSSFQRLNYARLLAQAKNAFMGSSPRYVIEAVGIMMIIGLAWMLQQRAGGLTAALPVLGALALGAQRLLPLMQQLYGAWSRIKGSQATLEDVITLLEQPVPKEYLQGPVDKKMLNVGGAKVTGESPQQRGTVTSAIKFTNLSFRYHPDGVDVLKDINLEIPIGKTVGIIGKTGSGKSTLIDLVMGLLEPTQGQIQVLGIPLTRNNRRSWQANIAHVPQAIYLADTNIAENVALGYEPSKINQDRVKTAIQRAQLSDFVLDLPQTYQTPVGERGVRLSGGQRQRIGLARAFYKEAHVLVLDEATSALDNDTETAVMNEIHGVGEDITVLMIAHRLSTLRNCDMIVELANGSVVRQGSYREIVGVPEETI